MSGLGHHDFGGRYCLELPAAAYDEFFTQLQSITTARGASTPPINERAWWATMAFDIDYERTEDEDEARRRKTHVYEVARIFVQELEMHFCGFEYASAIICVSAANRYRLYFPGVPYIGMVAVNRLVYLVKEKAYNDVDLRECIEAMDMQPMVQRHLRVHGTIGVDKEGGDKPSGRYRVSGIVCDSRGTAPATSRLSIRPDAAAYEKMLRDPENAYLRCCSNFVRQPRRDRADDSYWTVGLLSLLFDIEDDEESSEDSVFGEHSHERQEAIALLISPLVVVAEYKSDRCLLTAHGARADTGTVYYLDGSARVISGLNAVQLPEPVDLNDPLLLTGTHATAFTEQLRQPQVVDMSSFPVALFCYARGVTPVTPVYDADENTLEYVFRGATAERQVTHYADSNAYTQSIVELLIKSCNIELERFTVSSDTHIVSNRDIVRFSDAFPVEDVFALRNVHTEVMEIVAGCGVGKTVFALKVIDKLARQRARFSVLVVTPRAQLCTQLAVKLHETTGLETHIYTDGAWPSSVPACVVTLDSLVKCVAEQGVTRRPTLVLLDEIELTARHIATSETLSSSVSQRLRTLETLLILLASSRYIIAMDAHFGYAASMLLAMAALRSGRMASDRSIHFTRLQLIDNRVRQQYCVLADDYRRYVRIRDSLIEGRNVIVFEASPRKAQALMALLEPYVQAPATSLLVHGKSDAELKRMFSSNPSEYLRVNGVQLFIHTSSVGVGVSIDEPHFHEAHVAFRPHMSDEAAVQASHRARHLESSQLVEPPEEQEAHAPHVVREVFVRFDERMRFSERGLATIRTIGDAVSTFQRRIAMSREFYRKYADFARISEFDARVTVSLNDPNTLFVAALLAATEMSVNHQGIFTVMRVFDDSVSMRFEGTRSSDDELRVIREAERAVEFDLSVLPTDAPRTLAQKTRLAKSIGCELQEGLRSKAFQGRLAFGMSHPSNLRRFTALLVLMLVDDAALSLHMQRVLDNVTETMPLYAHDDARGITVAIEAVAAMACLRAFGIETPAQFASPQVLNRAPDWGVTVTNFTGGECDFDTLFETIMKRFRGPRWSSYWRNKTNTSKAARFLNSFFTWSGASVLNTRTMAWDARQVHLSAELVPGYCRAQGIEMPQVVLDWCAQYNGTWSRFIDDEARGVHQQAIY